MFYGCAYHCAAGTAVLAFDYARRSERANGCAGQYRGMEWNGTEWHECYKISAFTVSARPQLYTSHGLLEYNVSCTRSRRYFASSSSPSSSTPSTRFIYMFASPIAIKQIVIIVFDRDCSPRLFSLFCEVMEQSNHCYSIAGFPSSCCSQYRRQRRQRCFSNLTFLRV